MKRLAIALTAALGTAATLPPAPVLAQQASPFAVVAAPIRTGSSSIDGAFGVRLVVYDARSFELFWNRIPNATTYRVEIGGRTVQENVGISRYVSNADLSAGFDYTLTALDRSRRVLVTERFRVQPSAAVQLVAGAGAGAPIAPAAPGDPATSTAPPGPATGPIRTGSSAIGGEIPVRLAVYDAQSFELFWERVPGAATYRLERGGRTVQASGGTSRYVAGIDGSASFAYALAALDRSGNPLRSTRFTVSPRGGTQLAAGGSAAVLGTPVPTVDPDDIRLGETRLAGAIPVRLAVYDAGSYELFWERVSGAVRYRLVRDGETVQSSDAISRFYGGGGFTRRFDYTLEALDGAGNAIRAVRFTVVPAGDPQLVARGGAVVPPEPSTPPGMEGVLPADVARRLRIVFEIANGDPIERAAALARRLADVYDDGAPGFRLTDAFFGRLFGEDNRTYACPDGGTLSAFIVRTFIVPEGEFRAANCEVGPLRFDGGLGATNAGPFFAFTRAETGRYAIFDGFSLTDDRTSRTFDFLGRGVISADAFATLGYGSLSYLSDNGLVDALAVDAPDGGYTVRRGAYTVTADAVRQEAGRPPGLNTQFAARLEGEATDVRVRTRSPFTGLDASDRFARGALEIAGNGYAYALDAANGDPGTFQLDVMGNGSTTSYTVPWSEAFGFDRFDPNGVDLGF